MTGVLILTVFLLSGSPVREPATPMAEAATPAMPAPAAMPTSPAKPAPKTEPLDAYSEFDEPAEPLQPDDAELFELRLVTWLTRGLCFGVPLLLLGLCVGFTLLMVAAPSVGYRVAAWLPWSQSDRGRMRREMADLEGQLAVRDLPHLRYKLGRLCVLLGRPNRAAELLATVVAADSAHVDAAYFLGRAHLELGSADAALSALDAAMSAKPDHDYGGLRLWRARARLAVGRCAEAVEDLRLLLKSSPDLPAGLYWLGEAHAAAGDRQSARDAWQQCRASWQSGSATFRSQNREWMRRARARIWFG